MLTQTQLMTVLSEVKQDIRALGISVPNGIEYKVSKRMTRAHGNYCEFYQRDYTILGERKFIVTKRIIKVSADIPVELAHETLMHEVIHAINFSQVKNPRYENPGHGPKFQALAKLVNNTYPGKYHISTYASKDEAKAVSQVRQQKRAVRRSTTGNVTYIQMTAELTALMKNLNGGK